MSSRTTSFCLNSLALATFFTTAPVAMFSGLSPVGIGLVIAFMIMSLALHEVAHAWVALQRGDPTARDLGRITLNPIPHIDPVMTILVPVLALVMSGGTFFFGGAKPVPVVAQRLKHPLSDMALVALAGPVSNWLLAVVFGTVYALALRHGFYPGAAESFLDRQGQLFPLVMQYSMYTNLLLAVFNLLPIPPLDGSRVMAWLLPPSLRDGYVRLESIGLILVILICRYPPVAYRIDSAVVSMARQILSWVPA